MLVKPKKYLGQHFLKDLTIAKNITEALQNTTCDYILEIGPGMGVLTNFLLKSTKKLVLIEIDSDSVAYLEHNFKNDLSDKLTIIEADFLKMDLKEQFNHQFVVIGNFPYNISSQILFKTLEYKEQIPELVGMFQKEVAERICAKPNSKTFGILSVLIQAYYQAEYLFTVDEHVFNPPPKVKSGVLRLTKKSEPQIVNYKLLLQVIKTAFNQRRKKLRNAIKIYNLPNSETTIEEYLEKRAEQLTVEDFIYLTNFIEENKKIR